MSHSELLRLRDSIDNIDAALIHLLAERFKCTQAVGEFKAAHNLPPADPSREAAQIARLRRLAEDAKRRGRERKPTMSMTWSASFGIDPPESRCFSAFNLWLSANFSDRGSI